MKITNLFRIDYWTDLRPRYFDENVAYIFIAALIATLVAAVIIFFLKRRGGIYKHILSRVYSLLLSNFIVGALLFFFRFELVPFLSARFWAGIWVIVVIAWTYFTIKEAKKIPAKRKAFEAEKEKNKYIP